jgi:hypothetical protein
MNKKSARLETISDGLTFIDSSVKNITQEHVYECMMTAFDLAKVGRIKNDGKFAIRQFDFIANPSSPVYISGNNFDSKIIPVCLLAYVNIETDSECEFDAYYLGACRHRILMNYRKMYWTTPKYVIYEGMIDDKNKFAGLIDLTSKL